MRLIRLFYIILLTACCFQAIPVFCQSIENQFTHYTIKDGLTDGHINDIKQDSTGFLWVATHNGLCRFDGHSFKTFRNNPHDTTSLCENHINNIFIDAQNNLWCVSFNCLYLYHPEREWFEHFNMDGYNVQTISGEENNELILECSIKGLYKFDKKNKKLSAFSHPGVDCTKCRDYLKDREGIEWIGTTTRLTRFDPHTKKSCFIFNHTGRLLELPNSNILCATYAKGLLLINRETNAVKDFLPVESDSNSILSFKLFSLYQLNDSIILAGSDKGLSVFNWKTETFTNIAHEITNPSSLSECNEPLAAIYKDREGIVWVGNENLEKCDFSNFRIKTFPARGKESLVPEFGDFLNFFVCPDGKILLGWGKGMSIYDPLTDRLSKITAKEFTVDPEKNFRLVDNFQRDRKGNYWCYSAPDFCSFSVAGNSLVNIREHHFPFGFRIEGMMLDNKDRVYTTTSDRGFMRFDPADTTFTVFDTSAQSPARLTSMRVRAICVTGDGSTWAGTQKGINKIEKDGKTVKQFSQDKAHYGAITDWIVTDIKEDNHGIIWFSTLSHGIGRIDPATDSVTFLSLDQGLPTCLYQSICIDDYDYLWAKSKMGILRVNTLTLHYQLYTEKDEFPNPDDIVSMCYDKFNKKLYLLTAYAIYEIDAQSIRYQPKIPKTVITGFTVLDKEKPLLGTKSMQLKYNENFINIQFAALLFHNNELIKYAYKMEGVDKDWVYCNYKRNASYTQLPPGHYTFNVKAQSPEGIWNSMPAQLSIVILPPVWQTWWFYLLEIVTAFSIILWMIRLYTQRKLTKQRVEFEKLQAVSDERSRIASEMHDELGSGLTSIRMLSEIAGGKIGHNVIPKSEIEKIEKSATNLSENLREIIWTMNTRFDKLDDFIIYVRSYAVEFFDESPIKFLFTDPDIIPEITLNGELRRNLFLCIKEALNNIMKHSRATEASLTFNVIENNLIIEIKDNGAGINTNQINKFGNGLNTMKERLKKFGSSLEIGANGGTQLMFKVNIL